MFISEDKYMYMTLIGEERNSSFWVSRSLRIWKRMLANSLQIFLCVLRSYLFFRFFILFAVVLIRNSFWVSLELINSDSWLAVIALISSESSIVIWSLSCKNLISLFLMDPLCVLTYFLFYIRSFMNDSSILRSINESTSVKDPE